MGDLPASREAKTQEQGASEGTPRSRRNTSSASAGSIDPSASRTGMVRHFDMSEVTSTTSGGGVDTRTRVASCNRVLSTPSVAAAATSLQCRTAASANAASSVGGRSMSAAARSTSGGGMDLLTPVTRSSRELKGRSDAGVSAAWSRAKQKNGRKPMNLSSGSLFWANVVKRQLRAERQAAADMPTEGAAAGRPPHPRAS